MMETSCSLEYQDYDSSDECSGRRPVHLMDSKLGEMSTNKSDDVNVATVADTKPKSSSTSSLLLSQSEKISSSNSNNSNQNNSNNNVTRTLLKNESPRDGNSDNIRSRITLSKNNNKTAASTRGESADDFYDHPSLSLSLSSPFKSNSSTTNLIRNQFNNHNESTHKPAFEHPPPNKNNQNINNNTDKTNTTNSNMHKTCNTNTKLTVSDLATIQKLDEEYEDAIIEREIGWNARYISVRQNAGMSLWIMLIFLFIGTVFFQLNTEWTISESLLFSIYTITTVGYGNHIIPNQPIVLGFIIGYIFLGIALLTIMAAQMYQWIVLEATWSQYTREKSEEMKNQREFMKRAEDLENIMLDSDDTTNSTHSGLTLSSIQQQQQQSNSECAPNNTNNINKMSIVTRIHTKLQNLKIKTLTSLTHSLKYIENSFRQSPLGRLIIVLSAFFLMILLGALVVGTLQSWSFIESLYFAVVSLTTVGFGDYYPTTLASIWFCILWLPFSVGFMSLYLGTVAQFYIHLSTGNIKRIERNLRHRVYMKKASHEREMEEARKRATSSGFGLEAVVDDEDLETIEMKMANELKHIRKQKRFQKMRFSSLSTNDDEYADSDLKLYPDHEEEQQQQQQRQQEAQGEDWESSSQRREQVLKKSSGGNENITTNNTQQEMMMKTMNDVINAVYLNMRSTTRPTSSPLTSSSSSSAAAATTTTTTSEQREITQNYEYHKDMLTIHSTKHYNTDRGIIKRPPFALRVLVQERIAQIIAYQVAGYQSHVEIKENTLSVTIDTLKQTCDKWSIPRRARKAFRIVAFEALYFVGERALIVRGPDALFELRPSELQSIFAPLLVALGDADSMEAWLSFTNELAYVELKSDRRSSNSNSSSSDNQDVREEKYALIDGRRKNHIGTGVTANPDCTRRTIGNAISKR